MADQGESYPSGQDIRKRESQGAMAARLTEAQGGVSDEELLTPGGGATETARADEKKAARRKRPAA